MQLGLEVPCQGQTAGEPGSAGTALCGSTSAVSGGIWEPSLVTAQAKFSHSP